MDALVKCRSKVHQWLPRFLGAGRTTRVRICPGEDSSLLVQLHGKIYFDRPLLQCEVEARTGHFFASVCKGSPLLDLRQRVRNPPTSVEVDLTSDSWPCPDPVVKRTSTWILLRPAAGRQLSRPARMQTPDGVCRGLIALCSLAQRTGSRSAARNEKEQAEQSQHGSCHISILARRSDASKFLSLTMEQ